MEVNQNLLNLAKEVRALESKYNAILTSLEKIRFRTKWEDIKDSVDSLKEALEDESWQFDDLVGTILEKANQVGQTK